MSLTAQAKKLHPNRRNGAKWVMAIRYLRRKIEIMEKPNGKR
jgi:hypothetical protein